MTDPAVLSGPNPTQRRCPRPRSGRPAAAPRLRRTVAASLTAMLAFVIALLLPVAAFAQAPDPDADLPGRVGRVADLAGELFLSARERATDWTGVGVNTTITTGDNLWVSAEGRAEIDYGGGQFRLAGDANVHVARLDDTQLALFIAQGHLIVRVRVLDGGEAARVDTPNAQIQLLRPGLYRIDVDPDRQATQLVVREGEANVWLPAGSQQVLPGQTATVTGGESATGDVRNGASQDTFDAWSASRDRHYERGRTGAYVSRQMVGWADLEDNGVWNTDATYGAVWFPTTVADDWAPYRYGSWSWLPGWGWTWVDDAPWGYAPFHYGRWAFVGSRWGWIPGGYIARPVWAPALVGWYGGAGWSVSVGVGAPVFGWVPLGWGDPYLPSWNNCSRRCWTLYNRPYAVNHAERPHAPPTRYSNYGVPGAITAVGGATLVARKPVAPNRVSLPRDVASAPPVLAAAPALKPQMAPGARPASAAPAPPPAERYVREKPALGAGPGPRSGAAARPVSPAQPAPVPSVPAGGGAANPPAASGGSAAAPAWRATPPARFDPQPGPRAPGGAVAAPAAPPPAGSGGGAATQKTPAPRYERGGGLPLQAPGVAPTPPAAMPLPPAASTSPRAAPAAPPVAVPRGAAPVPAPAVPRAAAPAVTPAVPRVAAPAAPPAAVPAFPRGVAPAPAPPPAVPRAAAPAAVPVPPQAVPRGAAPAPVPVAPAAPAAVGERGGKPAPKPEPNLLDRAGVR